MAEEEEEVEGGEEGEEKPAEGGDPPPPSEIHINLTENGKFVASKLDALFAIVAKIQVKYTMPTPTWVLNSVFVEFIHV